MNFNIPEELKKLPQKPGVYIMHKEDDEVIYVGKAKNLKNRVRQYFSKSYKRTTKIEQMISHINYFEYIVVDNELESLILESNLIKEYRPRYNTLLKDDKNYPYIKVTIDEDYPRVFFVHKKNKDKAMYFGPYKTSKTIYSILDYIKKNYQIRNCKISIRDDNLKKDYLEDKSIPIVNTSDNGSRKECLYYHLKMCLAPCIKNDVKEQYGKQIKEICSFLNGNLDTVINKLKIEMNQYAEAQNFENAIKCRDKINSIYELEERQKIDQKKDNDIDIIGMYCKEKIAVIQIFEVRDGNIIDRNVHMIDIDEKDIESDIMLSFIKQYYNEPYFLPSQIWIPVEIEEKALIEKWLSNNGKHSVKIVIPKIGQNDKLVKLATQNAKIQWMQRSKKFEKNKELVEVAINTLKKITGETSIDRLESYDISNTAGSINVASMVVFENGNFNKKDYRKFKIKTVLGPDDYGSMREVLDRRIKRYIESDSKFSRLPDIFLIDGGMGQVNVVKSVLGEYNIDKIVMGMVKDDKHRTRALVYDDMEIDLKKYKELFTLITKIQDETHRFAIEYHKHLRSKEQIKSQLDMIPGIGEKRKMSLIKHFKDIENIQNASIDDILKVEHFNFKSANAVYEYFNSKNDIE